QNHEDLFVPGYAGSLAAETRPKSHSEDGRSVWLVDLRGRALVFALPEFCSVGAAPPSAGRGRAQLLSTAWSVGGWDWNVVRGERAPQRRRLRFRLALGSSARSALDGCAVVLRHCSRTSGLGLRPSRFW